MPLFYRISTERIEASIHYVYNHVLFVCMPGFPLKKLACLPMSIPHYFAPKIMVVLVDLNQEALRTVNLIFCKLWE